MGKLVSRGGVELPEWATLGMIRCPFKVGDVVYATREVPGYRIDQAFIIRDLPGYLDGSSVTITLPNNDWRSWEWRELTTQAPKQSALSLISRLFR